MYLHSLSAHIDDVFDNMQPESLALLKTVPNEEGVARFHHGWGTGIRNHYGLWKDDHPLTKNWHKNLESRDIRDGVDYSKDHPDCVSFAIMKGVWRKANA